MKITVIGAGYVGLVVAGCLADTGNDVICVDKDKDIIEDLKSNQMPIYEPGLSKIIKRSLEANRIFFTTAIKEGVKRSELIYIAVGTPLKDDNSVDLSNFYEAAKEIGQAMEDNYKIIINKSTVPVGTAGRVEDIIGEETDAKFDVVSNPEFLKEGTAVEDFNKPDRIIIGTDNPEVAKLLKELYAPFVRTGNPILVMNVRSAEMTKYASNAMLASRISFMNEIANLCDKVGADVDEVRIGMGKDPRIGPKFLFPGVGYGGSCFPKDVRALEHTGKEYGLEMKMCRAIDEVNEKQKNLLFKKVKNHFDTLKGKKFALWGLAFKPKTDDMRKAPSLTIIKNILKENGSICAYDPEAMDTARSIFKDRISYGEKPYDCLNDADALIVVTEWNEFRNPNFREIGKEMKNKVIFDGRNIYNPEKMKELGFTYFCIGREKSKWSRR